AGRAADERAGCGEATDCSYDAVRPIAIAGAEAAIDPKIEAGPVVDGGRQRGRKTWRWQIGRECLSGGSDDDSRCGNKHPPHATLLTQQVTQRVTPSLVIVRSRHSLYPRGPCVNFAG